PEYVGTVGHGPRCVRRGRRNGRHRRRPGGDVRPAVPEPRHDARQRQVRVGQPPQPRSAAADGRGGDRGAAQDRERERQSAACARDRAGLTVYGFTLYAATAISPNAWPTPRVTASGSVPAATLFAYTANASRRPSAVVR